MNAAPRDCGGPERGRDGKQPVYSTPPSGVRPVLVAVDLGAESCRISLLRWQQGEPEIRLVHRFANAPVQESGSLRWNLKNICEGVERGLRSCAELVPAGIAAIGVDGWAVDYVRLNESGEPLRNPYCYRDERSVAAQKRVHDRISPERLYRLTGVQILPLNTLYQLHADGLRGIAQNTPWLNLPEFMLHWLGGRRVSEYTNATHTQLLSIQSQQWCQEIFAAAELDVSAAPPLVRPGTDLGPLRGSLAPLTAFRSTRLIAPACHDTASAIAGIPTEGDDWAFISSGTWSLVGRILQAPCLSSAARSANFSNEGGIGGLTNFLKNVNGMWLLQQCMGQWRQQGVDWALDDLLRECESLPPPQRVIPVDDPTLLSAGNMLARINDQLQREGQALLLTEPGSAPAVASLLFHSLAARYAEVLQDLIGITGRPLRSLYIVGGGSKNYFLNRLTQQATGLPVIAGSSESATIGNFAAQLATLARSFIPGLGVDAGAVAAWAKQLNSPRSTQVETEYALGS